ncbi:uncharacterized protein LOC129576319 [Sitodiplosis mosellana]|uniref:uncharacterized protein LOC129576319 n=1 Tax=Sitodiplosis mosellana TaxID=263140 RepID=UPI0024449780|nr:uncharacterized protein LOC129576319 [Sitodiplosis mosellana]
MGQLIAKLMKRECRTKLKCLKTIDDSCLAQKYPKTLQRLDIMSYIGRFYKDELNTFFKLNPNVRNLAIHVFCMLMNQSSLIESNIKLDDLTIDDWKVLDEVYDLLNCLHERGFYKRLHYYAVNRIPPKDKLAKLPGLVTLFVHSWNNDRVIELPELSSLKELIFYSNHIYKELEKIPNLCINLERLVIVDAIFDDILPFIRHSMKLKEIEIKFLNENTLDIVRLDNERKKLNGAQKVIIFVSDKLYFATKCITNDVILDLIEIKNNDPHEQAHNFQSQFFHLFSENRVY